MRDRSSSDGDQIMEDVSSPPEEQDEGRLPAAEVVQPIPPPPGFSPRLDGNDNIYQLRLERYRQPEALGKPSKTLTMTAFVELLLPKNGEIAALPKLHVEQLVISERMKKTPMGIFSPTYPDTILYHDNVKETTAVVKLCEKYSSVKALLLRSRPGVSASKFPIIVLTNAQMMEFKDFVDRRTRVSIDLVDETLATPPQARVIETNTPAPPPPSYAQVAANDTPDQPTQNESGRRGWSFGRLGSAVGSLGSSLVTMLTGNSWKDKFEAIDKWNNGGEIYQEGMKLIASKPNDKDAEAIAQDLHSFLLRKTEDTPPLQLFWHVVFAARFVVNPFAGDLPASAQLWRIALRCLVNLQAEQRGEVSSAIETRPHNTPGSEWPAPILRDFLFQTFANKMNNLANVTTDADDWLWLLDIWAKSRTGLSWGEVDFHAIRASMPFTQQERIRGAVLTNPKSWTTLMLMLCQDLPSCHVALSHIHHDRPGKLPIYAAAVGRLVVFVYYEKSSVEELMDAVGLLSSCLDILDHGANKDVGTALAKGLANFADKRKMIDAASIVGIGIESQPIAYLTFRSQAFRFFGSSEFRPSINDIEHFVDSTIGQRFLSKAHYANKQNFILHCHQIFGSKSNGLCEKLLVLDRLCRVEQFQDQGKTIRLFTDAVEAEPDGTVAMSQALLAATERPDLFSDSAFDLDDDALRRIFTERDGLRLLRTPSYLLDVAGNQAPDEPGVAYVLLQTHLRETLVRAGPAFEKLITFADGVLAQDPLPEHVVGIVGSVCTHAFEEWNPRILTDITKRGASFINQVLHCLGSLSAHPECGRDVSSFRQFIDSIITAWLSKYNSGAVVFQEVERVYKVPQDCLDELGLFCEVKFPTKQEMEATVERFKSALSGVISRMMGPSETTLRDLFAAYQCSIDFLESLQKSYGCLSFETDKRDATMSLARTLHEIEDDKDAINAFVSTNEELVHICDYFLHNTSVLFRNAYSTRVKETVDHETMVAAIDETKVYITSLFDSSTRYEDVDEAMKIVMSKHVRIEDELGILLNCRGLDLTEEGIRRFRLTSTLYHFADNLRQLAHYLRAADLSISLDNGQYEELIAICDELNEPSRDNDDVLSRLWLLLTGINDTNPTFDEMLSRIEEFLPSLKFVAAIQANAEVRLMVRDMQWVGDEGLVRFRKEHDNITNILLSSSQTFETSILDSLLVVVLPIVALESFDHIRTIASFFVEMKNNLHIQKFCEEDRFEDFRQVHANSSLVREWFEKGIDEAALLSSKFKSINKTGHYVLLPRSENETLQGQHSRHRREFDLAIQYTLERGGSTESSILRGSDLTDFVLQVGLLNESEEMEGPISSFLQQHQILTKAANAYTTIQELGRSFDVEAFRCHVGNNVEDSGVVRKSQIELDKCFSWLQDLRQRHPTTLKFYPEELYILYECMVTFNSNEDGNEEALHAIAQLSRQVLGSVPSHDRLMEVLSIDMDYSQSWMELASKCLDALVQELPVPQPQRLNTSISGFHLHTISGAADSKELTKLLVLQNIFQGRLPAPYEMLDCSCRFDAAKLEIFLERSLHFPGIFVIVNVEMLQGHLLERLTRFLSARKSISVRSSFHCVQRERAIVHCAPWVKSQEWDLDGFDSHELTEWSGLVVDGQVIERVGLLWTAMSGTGKSRFIQQQLEQLRRNDSSLQSATIILHEGSTLSSLTIDLLDKVPWNARSCGVHFKFNYAPKREDDKDWIEMVQSFFLSLLVERSVHDEKSRQTFYCGERHWRIFVELPSSIENGFEWTIRHIPVLSCCAESLMPDDAFAVDDECRRVCMYLRAFEDGTIDRKFQTQNKEIIFLLDNSGSMQLELPSGRARLDAATDNALAIFDSHLQTGDNFGLVLFHGQTHIVAGLQTIGSAEDKANLRTQLDGIRHQEYGPSTRLYSALRSTLDMIGPDSNRETWIVCLTDGQTWDSVDIVQQQLLHPSTETVNIIVIGVGLEPQYEASMRLLCNKFVQGNNNPNNKGFYVASAASEEGIQEAFGTVGARIPVSETFELDGDLSNDECNRLIQKYIPEFCQQDHDKRLWTFWIRFLYRRVKVMDSNESFNYNEDHEKLGSTLLQTMLDEVAQLLDLNHSRDLVGANHKQLIYDFTNPDSPEFRLLCSSPRHLSSEERRHLQSLDLPGLVIPTEAHLRKRSTLDLLLSQAMGLKLHTKGDGENYLKCIDDNGFILTIDFTIKLLEIHERVACRLPCIIEGETGVSKTALTRMYSLLRNAAMREAALNENETHLQHIVDRMTQDGHTLGTHGGWKDRLIEGLETAAQATIGGETPLSTALHAALKERCTQRSCEFVSVPESFDTDAPNTSTCLQMLDWFCTAELENTFFPINVDSSLSAHEFVAVFTTIQETAEKLLPSNAVVVVFLDEFNTSSVMGLMEEIIIDHSIMGETLGSNVVVVAACNPQRKALTDEASAREKDLGREWVSGHYQVTALSPSMDRMKWSFGALNADQEKEFVFRRLEAWGSNSSLSEHECSAMTEMIALSHHLLRTCALQKISDHCTAKGATMDETDMKQRAHSVLSLRDIQRVFALFGWFREDWPGISSRPVTNTESMLLAIAVVYYLRLDEWSRQDFLRKMNDASLGVSNWGEDLEQVLCSTMELLIQQTHLPQGIAQTRGLKENAFMVLICSLSKTPLLIVGPPGSSKTLSVNTVADNANGRDSSSPLYQACARLSLFHYQCSRQTTSREIQSVFERAQQRQDKVDANHQCTVFMDEAGLPEEGRESLKALHYLLEGHMSAKANVACVAISNHVLDAAKSNRFVMLLRQEPDEEEMLTIVCGVLFCRNHNAMNIDGVIVDRETLAHRLCESYSKIPDLGGPGSQLETFFGLRDFVFFLKALLRNSCTSDPITMKLSTQDFVQAVESNFNGVERDVLLQICNLFLSPLLQSSPFETIHTIYKCLRDPIEVVRGAIKAEKLGHTNQAIRPRYKLLIDKTNDDSIMRLLRVAKVVDAGSRSLYSLSGLPEDKQVEALRLVSGVKFAAAQGHHCVLSNTESVNEAFYDLFNLHFANIVGKNGQVSLYTNIAVGGVSRRSKISANFSCVVHIKDAELDTIPAPFLNRFEAYCLSTRDVLEAGWNRYGAMFKVVEKARRTIERRIVNLMGESAFFGLCGNTLDSIFIDILPPDAFMEYSRDVSALLKQTASLPEMIRAFCSCATSLDVSVDAAASAIAIAKDILPRVESTLLEEALESPIDNGVASAALESILSSREEPVELASSLACVVMILMVQRALSLLMQIATPEAVYAHHKALPDEAVETYFEQEHYNLKRLIGRMVAKTPSTRMRLTVVYTRTDTRVFSIPSDVNSHAMDDARCRAVSALLCEKNVETTSLCVEHLHHLRSQAMFQASVVSWLENEERPIFVLLVDMSSQEAVKRTNYVRSFVEQYAETAGKDFFLVMHYPHSASIRKGIYPALFLGGWTHHFIDGTGDEDLKSNFLQLACASVRTHDDDVAATSSMLLALQSKISPHLASQELLYPGKNMTALQVSVAGTVSLIGFCRSLLGQHLSVKSYEISLPGFGLSEDSPGLFSVQLMPL